MYIGCDCNYDLCASQRNGDYSKWKWFDYCLYHAIWALSNKEDGAFPVYSGINAVKLDKKSVEKGYFVTYVSTSWSQYIATRFMKDKGMLIQFDVWYKDCMICCDVSWISKFPDECEVIFARNTSDNSHFKCIVTDESKGVQSVCLQKSDFRYPKHPWDD